MATGLDIEAARQRWVGGDYPIVNREHMRGLDAQVLADAFVSQRSQPVNQRLLEAAKVASVALSAEGWGNKASDTLDGAIAAAEAEMAERRKPVTEEWLKDQPGWVKKQLRVIGGAK